MEGDIVGDGGVHKFANTETGWPEFEYKFKKEYWGKGYVTEFAKAFMRFWWKDLPREDRQIRVLSSSLDSPHSSKATEQRVCCWIKSENIASQRIAEKVGFEKI